MGSDHIELLGLSVMRSGSGDQVRTFGDYG